MTTPNIAGLCERLRRKAGFNDPVTGEYVNFPTQPDGPEAADTLERQAAEIERLREGLNGAKHELRLVIRDIDAALTGEDTISVKLSD
jgi:hypothetical protein